MNPTTGMEARISELLAGVVEDQDGPTWSDATCREFGRLMQGYMDAKGTNTMFVIHRHDIPAHKTAAHVRMVADFRPQKPDPHWIRITIGGSNITVEYDVSTPTADLSTSKILINSTLSTPNAKWAGYDLMTM